MEGTDYRCWDELLPDVLAIIFKKLSLQEILTVIPRVCKPWKRAVLGPYCWQEIDIEEWSNRSEAKNVDKMVQMLIARTSGSLRKLCVSGLQNDTIFSSIAENARCLQTLRLPRSELKDSIIEDIAGRVSNVTFLDLSYCSKISSRALMAIGKNCKSLSGLCRNMHPLDVEGKLSQNDEALAIATTMPKLKHLEMAYLLIDTFGFLEIISSCPLLEYLDLRGCWEVKLDANYVKVKFPKLVVLGPHVVDHYECNAWEDCSDYYSDSDSFYDYESSDGGMWDDDDDDDDDEMVQLRFYEGFDEDTFYDRDHIPNCRSSIMSKPNAERKSESMLAGINRYVVFFTLLIVVFFTLAF